MTSASGPSNTRFTSVLSTQSAPSPSQAKAIWQGELDKDISERSKLPNTDLQWLNAERVASFKANVESGMEKFLQQNPNASAEEIREHAGQLINKHSMHEVIGKMSDDYFLNKLMQRTKELQEDMWK